MKPGIKIKYLRENRFGTPLTQEQLCEALNNLAIKLANDNGKIPFTLSKQSLSRYEIGKVDVSSIQMIQALCIFFEVSPSYFIVVREGFSEELFELDIDSLHLKKIMLKKIDDNRIKSLVYYENELICSEFAVKLPVDSLYIYDSPLDYLLDSSILLQPNLGDFIYIRVKSINPEDNFQVLDKNSVNLANGSYLIFFSDSQKLGLLEKFSTDECVYIFEHGILVKTTLKPSDKWFYVGFIISQNEVEKHNNILKEMFESLENFSQ